MANIFDEWDKNVDDSFLNEIKAQDENKTPYGVYECTIGKIEIGESKNHKPMLKVMFNVIDTKRKIFVNQVIEKPFQISIAKKLLESMETDEDVMFVNYSQFNDVCLGVKNSADELKLSFEVNYTQEKGYDKVEITNVFEN